MKQLFSHTAVIAAAFTSLACNADIATTEAHLASGSDQAILPMPTSGDLAIFHSVGGDVENGIVLVAALGQDQTECFPGRIAPSCKVARLDFSNLPDSRFGDAQLAELFSLHYAMIEGWLEVEYDDGAPIVTLHALESWLAESNEPVAGDFFQVEQSDIQCGFAPCTEFLATRVNTSEQATISKLDFSQANESDDAMATATKVLKSDARILTTGEVQDDALLVRRLYLPITL